MLARARVCVREQIGKVFQVSRDQCLGERLGEKGRVSKLCQTPGRSVGISLVPFQLDTVFWFWFKRGEVEFHIFQKES